MSYELKFTETESEGIITKRWAVDSTKGRHLGSIRWFGNWNEYTFWPSFSTVFDAKSMKEIARFCEIKTTEHKEAQEMAKVNGV